MAEFTVHPEALKAFGTKAEGLGTSMDTLAKSLLEARVGRDAFGHIPTIGSRIYDAYDKHVDQCEDTTLQAASAIHSVAANIGQTADVYEKTEEGNTVK